MTSPAGQGKTALATTNNRNAGKYRGEYLKGVLKDGDTIGILEGACRVCLRWTTV